MYDEAPRRNFFDETPRQKFFYAWLKTTSLIGTIDLIVALVFIIRYVVIHL